MATLASLTLSKSLGSESTYDGVTTIFGNGAQIWVRSRALTLAEAAKDANSGIQQGYGLYRSSNNVQGSEW